MAEPARGIEFIRRMYERGSFTLIDSPNAAVIHEDSWASGQDVN